MQYFKPTFFLCCFLALLVLWGCKKDPVTDPGNSNPMDSVNQQIPGTTYIEPHIQRPGDPQAGLEYLIYGNYISSGIPYDIFTVVLGENDENVLNRTGDNAVLGPDFTAIDHANGTRIVVANCLQCHGSKINGEYILGLGNINADFSESQEGLINGADFILGQNGTDNPNWEAYEIFSEVTHAIANETITRVAGTNPADHLFGVLAAYRNPETLEWQDELNFDLPEETFVTDIPPWWHLKKKNSPLYGGNGRGDYSKLFMAASTLTLTDTVEAKVIDSKFPDVIAFIQSLEAPVYPFEVDVDLATNGETIFNTNCSGCHGTYGENETYPNLLVDIDVVKTDPAIIETNGFKDNFIDWFNESWFAQGDEYPGELVTTNGYIAPPLDGVWATAPYLHNGSVPTLYELLNSDARAPYWRRDAETPYDKVNVGWAYEQQDSKVDNETYDVSLYGYSNQGHTFGDALNEEDRMALIEYLKTI